MEAREQTFVAALGPSEVGLGGGLDMGIGGGGGGGGLGAAAEAESPSSSPSPSPTPSPPPLPQPPVPGAGGMEGIVQPPPPPPPSADVMGPAMGMGIGMVSLGSSGGGGGSDDLMLLGKKKRGRPRKYGPDGMALALSPNSASPSPFFASSDSSGKRGKGRPAGSGKRQLLSALGDWFTYSAGGNFTPHVVTVATGEDVAAKILSFSQKGPRAICILSANGAISNVTLRQPGSCGGTLTYEGRFEILSLSGSFMVTDDGGMRSRTGGISVSLAGPDGRVVGGGVAGLLLAASPIQVVIGSFIANAFKEHKRKATADGMASAIPPVTGVLTAARPISQANPNGDCETPPTSTLPAQVHGDVDNSISNLNHNSYSGQAAGWHGLHSSEHRPSPDINICLHGE